VLDGRVDLAANSGSTLRNHVSRLDISATVPINDATSDDALEPGMVDLPIALPDAEMMITKDWLVDWLKDLPWPLNRQGSGELFSLSYVDSSTDL
jgi:hypothetical protein